ncbi:MAG TPA: beta-N-acetylhexosaminidase, partial [Draconibacterium sp.]|nr:beta-N-acetylhexosaminidase [Draconibacterium sp.]
MKQNLILLIVLLFFVMNVSAQELAIIPKPAETSIQKGSFVLDKNCTLQFDASNKEIARIASFFNEYLNEMYGFTVGENSSGKSIQLKLMSRLNLGKEGYLLKVNNNIIVVTAAAPNGLFYGIQSLKQILPVEATKGSLLLQAVDIKDQPRFAWRGNMLDVGRHFFPVSFLKKYIDILAMYKINTFHWHLTEDQGWRLEIKKYPLLTETSSWRDETVIGHNTPEYDGIGYGGFYTQEQAREIVKYAAERYITVVPEIEMPGHSVAALTAYPNLGCTGGPYEVKKNWGVSKDVYCAGKDETFVFLKNVLDEVMDIFPSKFIHIGGDECPKDAWEKCPDCQKRIVDEGLKNEHELQSWFITQMDDYLTSKGRRLVG